MEVGRRTSARFAIVLGLVRGLATHLHSQEPCNPPPTFTKNVAPILQRHCQTCHRSFGASKAGTN
jgi:hypothetical protein